jgi:hypothetical protein
MGGGAWANAGPHRNATITAAVTTLMRALRQRLFRLRVYTAGPEKLRVPDAFLIARHTPHRAGRDYLDFELMANDVQFHDQGQLVAYQDLLTLTLLL